MKSMNENGLRVRLIVERCVNSILHPGDRVPGEDEDWLDSGAVDSMGYVELLLSIETAMGVSGLFTRGAGALPCTTRQAIELALMLADGVHPSGGASQEL